MTNTIRTAMQILKESGAKGKFRAYLSEANKNEVDIFTEAGFYCTINIKTGKIKES